VTVAAYIELLYVVTKAYAQGSQSRRNPGEAVLTVPVHPLVASATRRFSDLGLKHLLVLNFKGFTEDLACLVSVAPEGTLYFIYGTALGAGDRWDEAETAFITAADLPSMLHIQQAALFNAAAAANMLAIGSEPLAKERLIAYMRKLDKVENLPIGHVRLLSIWALYFEDWDLAHWYLAEWLRQVPDDAELAKYRAILEFKTNAYGPAIEWADKILIQKPRDTKALEIRQQAIQRLREQLKVLEPASPGPKTP
jgi:tetratricopeptide (TPR) repeat protein